MPSPPKPSIRSDLQAAERFAARFPLAAGALGGASHEAALERVREALFYLGAVTAEEIRALEGEGYRALANMIAPDLMRPLPAATLVELSTEGPSVRALAGAEIETGAGPVRRFRLVSDIDVGAWRIEGSRVERGRRDQEALCFELVATGPTPLAEALPLGRGTRIFVDGPREAALAIVAHVLGHCARVAIEADGEHGVAGPVLGYGTNPTEVLAPEPDGPPTSAGLLREYFVLPEKFAFFVVNGLAETLAASAKGARRATVRVSFDAPLPARAALSHDGLRAHCGPAVNLFPATSEPRTVGPAGFRFPLRVAGYRPLDGGVYAVLGVSASRVDGAGPPVRVPPVRRFAAAPMPAAFPYAHSTEVAARDGAGEEGLVFLSIVAPERPGTPRSEARVAPHVVSVDLLATNRAAGSEVRPGELCNPGVGLPPGVRVRNIVPTSAYLPAPVGPEFALRVAVRGALPPAGPLWSLKAFLFAQVPRHGVEDAVVRAAVGRIDAIESLDVSVVATTSGRGYLASFAIDESRFSGTGDVALFLRLLHRSLDAHGSINHPYRCEALLTKSMTRIACPPERSP